MRPRLVDPVASPSGRAKCPKDAEPGTHSLEGPTRILLVGTSFRTAALPVREMINDRLSRRRLALGSLPGVTEHAEINTCNRIELVFATRDPDFTERELFSSFPGISRESFYVRRDSAAIAHLFRVASGLDSMVLGEDQILSQVRDAGIRARTARTSKGVLSSLFDAAGSVGSRARESLGTAGGGRSVSAFALRFALERLGQRPKRVLLIGSGKTIRLAVGELSDSKVYMATRRNVSHFPGVTRIRRSQMAEAAKNCDLIISATKHSGYLLKGGSLDTRRRRVILDLAFPRNIDPALNRELTSLYNMDDLAATAATLPRAHGADRAEKLVVSETEGFLRRLVASRLSSAVSDLHQWAESMRKKETSVALRRMPRLSEREKTLVEVLSKRLTSKLLASPTRFSKSSTSELPQNERLDLIHQAFGRGEKPEQTVSSPSAGT